MNNDTNNSYNQIVEINELDNNQQNIEINDVNTCCIICSTIILIYIGYTTSIIIRISSKDFNIF